MKKINILKYILLLGLVTILMSFQAKERIYFYKGPILKIYCEDYKLIDEVIFPPGSHDSITYSVRVFDAKKNNLGSEKYTDNRYKLEYYDKKYIEQAILEKKGKIDIESSKDNFKILKEKRDNRLIYYYLYSESATLRSMNTGSMKVVSKSPLTRNKDLIIEIIVNGKLVYNKKNYFKDKE